MKTIIKLILIFLFLFLSNLNAQISFENLPEAISSQLLKKKITDINSLTKIFNSQALDQIDTKELTHENGFLLKETIQQVWDENRWKNEYRYINYFDERNNLVMGELQWWKGDSAWYTYMRAFYSYDQNNNKIEFYDEMLNGDNWENYRRHIYDYDYNNNLVSQFNQIWDGAKWEYISNIVLDYNRNNLIEELHYKWENQKWVNEKRWTFRYNLNSNIIEFVGQYWEGFSWINDYKWIYSYYPSQNLKDETYNNWENSEWNIGTKSTYMYDTNNNMIESLWQIWDELKWKDLEQNILEYDAFSNKIQQVKNDWRDTEWLPFYRWFYNYDVNNNNLSELGQLFINSNWRDDYAILYTYDENNNLIDRIHQFGENGQLANGMRFQFQYIPEIEDTLNGNVPSECVLYQNYPNPFNSVTTISYKIPKPSFVSIQIYSSLGEFITSLENQNKPAGTYQITFNADNLSSGIYFLRLNAGKYTQSKKIILLK